MHAYVTSDFSVANVAANSHSTKPLHLQDGRRLGQSRRLDAAVGADPRALRRGGRALRQQLAADAEGARAGRAGVRSRSAFLLFIAADVEPVHRVSIRRRPRATDLNPILQDPALAFHPPFLYTGYVGFSIAFSFAIAALIEGRIDAAWARWVRPWTLAAWMFLTVGIAMGSWWAYYELGWGGWWFWDPVENASFMPWLAGTALLHSAIVMEKRGALKVWTVLLAILTFSLSLLGTFLVRSGVLTSVHAFAVDPTARRLHSGHPVLFTAAALALFAWRAPKTEAGRPVRADQPRGRAGPQQPPAGGGAAHGARRHALSAGARGADRREDLGRAALLQPDLRVR